MSEAENDGSGKGSPAVPALVTCWVLVLMTAMIAANYHAQISGRHYEIPQFLVDIFVYTVQITVGAGAGGTAIAAAATVLKVMEKRKTTGDSSPPKNLTDSQRL